MKMAIVCYACGALNSDDAKFCVECGGILETPQEQNNAQQSYEEPVYQEQARRSQPEAYEETAYQSQPESYEEPVYQSQPEAEGDRRKKIQIPNLHGQFGQFADPREIAVATLGTGILKNGAADGQCRGQLAVLTNKRLYYRYTMGLLNRRTVDSRINVRDITATGVRDQNIIGWIVLAIIAACVILWAVVASGGDLGTSYGLIAVWALAVAAISLILYFLTKRKFLRIEYDGGHVDFSVKPYNIGAVRDFACCIHIMKDQLMED
jgi:hypothetical protein